MVQNILLFIPFGFLGYFSLIYKSSWIKKIAIVFLGAGLSTSVEFLQIFSPLRYPALADIIFNTIGTIVGLALGILLKKSVLEFKSHPRSRKFIDAPSAFPAAVFLILVVGGCWEPFNFSLDVGNVWSHIKPLLHHPFTFSLPNDDVFACIQFILATLFVCRVLQEVEWRSIKSPALIGCILMMAFGIFLEGTQCIIQSRMPEVQDALVAMAGTLIGAVIFHFPGFRERPIIWGSAATMGVFASAAVRGLHPFIFTSTPSNFNWIPFLPQYEKTTAAALGEFLANGMVYFPLGFLLGYFFSQSKRIPWIALALSLSMSLLIEVVQGFVVGRYSDITNTIGAILGCALGSLVLTRGWSAYTIYMRQEDDDQV